MVCQCRERLTTRQRLQSHDYRVHHGVAVACRFDIDTYSCNQHPDVGISSMLDCLENVTRNGTCYISDWIIIVIIKYNLK